MRYFTGPATLHRDTEKAVMISFDWSDVGYVASQVFVPKSVFHESCQDDIEDACEGDTIEVSLAEWWLRRNIVSA
jgi:hypothetical protein